MQIAPLHKWKQGYKMGAPGFDGGANWGI